MLGCYRRNHVLIVRCSTVVAVSVVLAVLDNNTSPFRTGVASNESNELRGFPREHGSKNQRDFSVFARHVSVECRLPPARMMGGVSVNNVVVVHTIKLRIFPKKATIKTLECIHNIPK